NSAWNRDNLKYTNDNFKAIEDALNDFLKSLKNINADTIPSDNSVTTEKLKDKAIVNSKLADQFSSVRTLNDNEDISLVSREGIYFKSTTIRL
ncbi:hypothetical protein, partial [Corynebacterium kefirresidentii]